MRNHDSSVSFRYLAIIATVIAIVTPDPSVLADPPECERLIAADGALGHSFGRTVAISGDVAVVGSWGDNDIAFNAGSAYVYRFNGAEWKLEQKLLASDGLADDFFGGSVSVSGDLIVVGAHLDDDHGSGSGSAYVFRYNGAKWVQEAKLLPNDGSASDEFGTSVSVFATEAGAEILVGAPRDDDVIINSGSAYVFVYDSKNKLWVQYQKLSANDPQADDYFGTSVSIFGGRAVVGAPGDDDNGDEAGAAYAFMICFVPPFILWGKMLADDGAAGDGYGSAVFVGGSLTLIGAPYDDRDNGQNFGSVYTFKNDICTWRLDQKLEAADGQAGDRFGASVATRGSVAAIGATRDDDNGSNAGSAYLFLRIDYFDWIQEHKLHADDGEANDSFGGAVALDGDFTIIGAPLVDTNRGTNAGAAYIFGCPPPRPPTADLDGDGDVDFDDFTALLAAWGEPGCGGALPCAADIDGDGNVDFDDFTALLAAWTG